MNSSIVKRTGKLLSGATIALVIASSPALAFKAKYYKDCHAPVKEAEPLVSEKGSTGKSLGKAAGIFGKVGSFAGLGGGLGSAANTAAKVSQYSGYIENASALTGQMQTDFPDEDDRWGAYGDQMDTEANDLLSVRDAVSSAQACYDAAYTALGAEVAAGNLKSKSAKKQLKEIQKGSMETGDLLKKSLDRMNNNLSAYDQALGTEASGLNFNPSSLAGGGQASYCKGASGQLASWCAQYGSNPQVLNADQFSTNYYAGKAASVPSFGNLSGLASLGSLKNAGLANTAASLVGGTGQAAKAVDMSGVNKVSQSSGKYMGVYESTHALIEPQKALEAKVQQQPWE